MRGVLRKYREGRASDGGCLCGFTSASGAWQCLPHSWRGSIQQNDFFSGCGFNLSIWIILGYVARSKLCKSMPVCTQVHKHTHLYTLRKCKLMQPRCYTSGIINWRLVSWKPSVDILGLAHSEFLGCINNSQYFKGWEISMKIWLLLTLLPLLINRRRVVNGPVQFVTAFTTPPCHLSGF